MVASRHAGEGPVSRNSWIPGRASYRQLARNDDTLLWSICLAPTVHHQNQ